MTCPVCAPYAGPPDEAEVLLFAMGYSIAAEEAAKRPAVLVCPAVQAGFCERHHRFFHDAHRTLHEVAEEEESERKENLLH